MRQRLLDEQMAAGLSGGRATSRCLAVGFEMIADRGLWASASCRSLVTSHHRRPLGHGGLKRAIEHELRAPQRAQVLQVPPADGAQPGDQHRFDCGSGDDRQASRVTVRRRVNWPGRMCSDAGGRGCRYCAKRGSLGMPPVVRRRACFAGLHVGGWAVELPWPGSAYSATSSLIFNRNVVGRGVSQRSHFGDRLFHFGQRVGPVIGDEQLRMRRGQHAPRRRNTALRTASRRAASR